MGWRRKKQQFVSFIEKPKPIEWSADWSAAERQCKIRKASRRWVKWWNKRFKRTSLSSTWTNHRHASRSSLPGTCLWWNRVLGPPSRHVSSRKQEKKLKWTNCHSWLMRGGVATRPNQSVGGGGRDHMAYFWVQSWAVLLYLRTRRGRKSIIKHHCCHSPLNYSNRTILPDFNHSPVSRHHHSNQLVTCRKFFRILRGKLNSEEREENEACNNANGQQGETWRTAELKEHFTKKWRLSRRRRFEGRKQLLRL